MASQIPVSVKPTDTDENPLTLDELEVWKEMNDIVNNIHIVRIKGPFEVLPYLFLGNFDSATNVQELKKLGINYVINMAKEAVNTGPEFYGEDVKYLEFAAQDFEGYDIFQHYDAVERFIDEARLTGGKCLIHCMAGINRSGVLLTAYCVQKENMPLLTAVKHVMERRGILLTNEGFQKRLLKFTTSRGLSLR